MPKIDVGGFGGGLGGFEFGGKWEGMYFAKNVKKIRVWGSSGGGQKS